MIGAAGLVVAGTRRPERIGQMGLPALSLPRITAITVTLGTDPVVRGDTIASYDLQYSVNAGVSWTTILNAAIQTEIIGLSSGTTVMVRNRAVGASGKAGRWSLPASMMTLVSATVKQSIIDLRNQTLWNGHRPANVTKRVGVDALPAGFSNPATSSLLTNNSYTGDLVGWDFRGWQFVNKAVMGKAIDCIFGDGSTAGLNSHIDPYPGSSMEFEYCSFLGGGANSADPSIGFRNSGTGTAYVAGWIRQFLRCRWDNCGGDLIKLAGAPGGQRVIESYYGPPINMPAAWTAWNSTTTYAAGQFVNSGNLMFFSNVNGNLNNPPPPNKITGWVNTTSYAAGRVALSGGVAYRSKVNGNVGNVPVGGAGDAFWEVYDWWRTRDPHGDANTVVAGKGGIEIYRCLIDWVNQVPGTGTPLLNWGLVNGLRNVRNTGTTFQVDLVRLRESIIYYGHPIAESFPTQVQRGTNYIGPVEYIDSWIQPNGAGQYFHSGTNNLVDRWANVRDVNTDALIAPPTGAATI